MEKRLEELAELVGARLVGDGELIIDDAASIDDAGAAHITFVASSKLIKGIGAVTAGALIVAEKDSERDELKGRNLLVVPEPALAFAKILDTLRPEPVPEPGVHPGAEVHPGAVIAPGASVGAFVVVKEGAKIGENATVHPGVYIGHGSTVGEGSVIYPGVTIREGTKIGARVVIHANTAIGSDGFGFVPTDDGYKKIPQRGTVTIEDDCEIGSCVTIDRATTGETVIGRGTKIDNLVQVAHNVRIGENSVIVAQVGISGSTKVGSNVQIGGQAGLVGHINIGDNVRIGAKSGVSNDIAAGEAFSGSPAVPHGTWLRAQTIIKRLPELKKLVESMEKRIKELEEETGKGRGEK